MQCCPAAQPADDFFFFVNAGQIERRGLLQLTSMCALESNTFIRGVQFARRELRVLIVRRGGARGSHAPLYRAHDALFAQARQAEAVRHLGRQLQGADARPHQHASDALARAHQQERHAAQVVPLRVNRQDVS